MVVVKVCVCCCDPVPLNVSGHGHGFDMLPIVVAVLLTVSCFAGVIKWFLILAGWRSIHGSGQPPCLSGQT